MEASPRRAAPGNGAAAQNGGDVLHEEEVKPREMAELPPLFLRLEERPAERLHYVGVSFGLTQQLLRFWQKLKFSPLYLRQTASDVTGEHTCIMLKALASEQVDGTVRAALLPPSPLPTVLTGCAAATKHPYRGSSGCRSVPVALLQLLAPCTRVSCLYGVAMHAACLCFRPRPLGLR